jgi:hypothetical protein
MFRTLKLTSRATLLALTVVVLGNPASATHSWKGYHWAWNAFPSPIPLILGNNVGSTWAPFLETASTDWSTYPAPLWQVFNTAVVNGGINPKTCKGTSGMVQVCAARYGYNGWLGAAQIWLSGAHITKGTVKLNDSYFALATYNQPYWRQMVVCQEVGHTFGLDHQDTDQTNTNLGTCMDYTNEPLGPPDNEHPNYHDYEELNAVYNHNDSISTVATPGIASSSPAIQLASFEDVSMEDWGKAVGFTRSGKGRIFVKELSPSERVITFVTWAEP